MCVRRAIRVLQVVYSLDPGGVETWLMHILRNIDRTRFQLDFVTFSDSPGSYAEEAEQLGSKIFSCPPVKQPMRHSRQFSKILQQHGPYDVVHSHDAVWNGPVMLAAKNANVPVRIIHSHNVLSQIRAAPFLKRFYISGTMRLSRCYATHGLACSDKAAHAYFGRNWREDSRWNVLHCGVDLSLFRQPVDTDSVRKELNLDKDDFVIGHVGSFREEKNHELILRIASEIATNDQKARFLLIGEGPTRSAIQDKATQLGLDTQVLFAGLRADVPQLMLGAMDMFLFPSLFEGLGLVLVEAQAAGLPCVCSDVIPEEADVVPELITRISLAKSPAEWARAILETRNARRRISQAEALGRVENGPFNLSKSIEQLEEVYSCKPPKAKLARDRLERK